MLFFSLFLSGFTLGVFAALKVFAPESREESWDPQHFPLHSAALHNGGKIAGLKKPTVHPVTSTPILRPRLSSQMP